MTQLGQKMNSTFSFLSCHLTNIYPSNVITTLWFQLLDVFQTVIIYFITVDYFMLGKTRRSKVIKKIIQIENEWAKPRVKVFGSSHPLFGIFGSKVG